jgi:hypothetical protein
VQTLCNKFNAPEACQRVNELGGSTDVEAAKVRYDANADREFQENQEQTQRRKEELAQNAQDRDAHRNAVIGALQSMPGANDPNAIVNAGNQQAAVIRATGDANAAQQQATAEQRAAAELAAQQAAQRRTAAQQAQQAANQKASSSVTGTPGGNSNSPSSGGSGTSGGNAGSYLAPITQGGVREFWDPKFYNWLSFENDCGQAISLTWIAKNPSDHFGGASNNNIAPGQSTNTGWSQTEVAAKGDFALFICPAGSVAVDGNTHQAISSPNATYSCKKQ